MLRSVTTSVHLRNRLQSLHPRILHHKHLQIHQIRTFKNKMGKKKSNIPGEEHLLLPTPPSNCGIVDTHTHLASTFAAYRSKYPGGQFTTVHELVRGLYTARGVEAIVDVWCEAPVQKIWREFADSALEEGERKEKWGGMDYWFVMGVHPHEAKYYTDEVEQEIIEAMSHPRCVGWGEMGLDYHYDNSPRDVQQAVFERQLRHAVRLGKPLTIHTREADNDTERILKAEVPKDYRIHIHCFTDSPTFAQNLLDHFPNLYIGITGVITYASNQDTSTVVRTLASPSPSATSTPTPTKSLRILLETDAPYMVPANLYESLPPMRGKLPLCHSAMVPWTAQFVAGVANGAGVSVTDGTDGVNGEGVGEWDANRVMREAREGARVVYGI